jgi:hypothetical protein
MTDRVLERIRIAKPAMLDVEVSGETKRLAVPAHRNKWTRLRATIDNLGPWTRIECLDKAKSVIAVIDNDERPAGELEDLDDGGSDDGVTLREKELLQLMLKSQDVALARHEKLLSTLLDSHVKLLDLVSKRLTSLEGAYAENFEILQDALKEAARGADGSGSEEESQAMKLALAMLPHMLKGGSPSPNGGK